MTAGGLTHRQVLVIYSGLALGMLLAALDGTIIATALPTIVGDLGGLDRLSWVVTAYLLTATASTPLYGKLSDLYGRRRIFQTAIVIFLIGSALAGLSQTLGQLIAFRAVQGIGAGGLLVCAHAIIGDILSPRERGKYQGYMGGMFAIASVAGPILGGLLVDGPGWRWIFLINIPIGLVALVVTSIVLRLPPTNREPRIDWRGAAYLTTAVTAVLLATSWGGVRYAWQSPLIVFLFAATIVLAVAFVRQERRAAEPILPPRLFGNRVFLFASGLTLLMGFMMLGAVVFLPVFLQVVAGASPSQSGLLLVPMMFGIILTSITTGRIVSHTGRTRLFPIAGTATVLFGYGLLATMDADSPLWLICAFTVVIGIGQGLTMQVLVVSIQNAVEHRDLGAASSAVPFFRSLGGALGVAVYGSILAHQLAADLPSGQINGFSARDLVGTPERIMALPDGLHDLVINAFASGLHVVFLCAIPAAAVAFLLALRLPEKPLRDWAHVEAVGVPGGRADGLDEAPQPASSGASLTLSRSGSPEAHSRVRGSPS